MPTSQRMQQTPRSSRVQLAVCCICLAAAAGCRPGSDGAGGPLFGGGRIDFKSETAGFRASYPAPPTDKAAENGKHTYAWDDVRDMRYVGVVYIPATDASVPLADRVEVVHQSLHTTAPAVSDVEVDGCRGVDASYERVKDGRTYRSRMRLFYKGGALYEVQGVIVKGLGGEADVERFFESFHFLPDNDPAAGAK